jgi:hypothetical protein
MKNFLINAAIKTVDITLYVKEGANTLTDLHRQATFTEKGRINKTPKECLITILKVWLQELEQTHNQKM